MIEILNMNDGVFPIEDYDFRVDRQSPVGNKLTIGHNGTRDEVCDGYDQWFTLHMMYDHSTVRQYVEQMIEAYREHGKLRLFCWCTPRRCHGETIKRHMEKLIRSLSSVG